MSRDDTVGVIRVKCRGRYVYVVLHAQAFENFEDWSWFSKWFNGRFSNIQWTPRRDLALNIARKMDKDAMGMGPSEYGVVEVDWHKDRDIATDLLPLRFER